MLATHTTKFALNFRLLPGLLTPIHNAYMRSLLTSCRTSACKLAWYTLRFLLFLHVCVCMQRQNLLYCFLCFLFIILVVVFVRFIVHLCLRSHKILKKPQKLCQSSQAFTAQHTLCVACSMWHVAYAAFQCAAVCHWHAAGVSSSLARRHA